MLRKRRRRKTVSKILFLRFFVVGVKGKKIKSGRNQTIQVRVNFSD